MPVMRIASCPIQPASVGTVSITNVLIAHAEKPIEDLISFHCIAAKIVGRTKATMSQRSVSYPDTQLTSIIRYDLRQRQLLTSSNQM